MDVKLGSVIKMGTIESSIMGEVIKILRREKHMLIVYRILGTKTIGVLNTRRCKYIVISKEHLKELNTPKKRRRSC